MNFTPNFAGIINALKYIIENGIAGSGGSGGSGGGGATSQKQEEQTQLITNLFSKPTQVNTGIPNPLPISSTVSTIPANPSRKGLTIYNPLAFDIFVGFQATVSDTSYAVKLSQDYPYYETPYNYTGIVSVVCSTGNNGNISVRELI